MSKVLVPILGLAAARLKTADQTAELLSVATVEIGIVLFPTHGYAHKFILY